MLYRKISPSRLSRSKKIIPFGSSIILESRNFGKRMVDWSIDDECCMIQ